MTELTVEPPNLFVPGAAKGGTSTLHRHLARHPDVAMPQNKEPGFYLRGGPDDAQLRRQYMDSGTRFRGDLTTTYMMLPEVLSEIAATRPSARVVVVLRDPVERAWSHYWWARAKWGIEERSFRSAVEADIVDEPRLSALAAGEPNLHYFQAGRYGRWLGVLTELFDPAQIRVLLFRDLVTDTEATLDDLYDWLGIERIPYLHEHANPTRVARHPRLLRGYYHSMRFVGRGVGRVVDDRTYMRLVSAGMRVRRVLQHAGSTPVDQQLGDDDRAWLTERYLADQRALVDVIGHPVDWSRGTHEHTNDNV